MTEKPARDAQRRVLHRSERAARPRIKEERITLAHGAGGKAARSLVEALFVAEFRDESPGPLGDGADISLPHNRIALTTDSFVMSPLFFPGGNIGDLAVNATVNDLAVTGADPLYLSAGFVLEEGFPVADLRRVVRAMAAAATAAGVRIVTGDTKVVDKGRADGCYINTTGVGVTSGSHRLGISKAQPGDSVLVTGPIGAHGATIMLARGELDVEAGIVSDTAALHGLVANLLEKVPGVRALRDATRGGVATVLNEIARASRVAVVLDEGSVPVGEQVRGAAELLGIDPLYIACEGRAVVVIDGSESDAALAAMREHPLEAESAVIGRIGADPPGMVLADTAFGGARVVDPLVGDPLPRIC